MSQKVINGVAHVGINVTDLARSIKFYTEMLGFQVIEECELQEENGVCKNRFSEMRKSKLGVGSAAQG